MKRKSYNISVTGLLLALGVLLPFVSSHAMGIPGTVLLPMHIPVILCGFICGPLYGVVLGIILPFISSLLTGMPTMYPMAVIMCAELGVYGLVSGLIYRTIGLRKYKWGIFPSLIFAMILGRVAYGLVFSGLFMLFGKVKGLSVIAAVTTGLPGIILQIVFIPILVKAIELATDRNGVAVKSAINLIEENRLACSVIKNGVIVKSEQGRGIGPIISLYESGVLKGAYVVDKVVGKGAAMVMTLGEIKGCHAVTVSQSAVKWFKEHGISINYNNLVDHIVNRTGDGFCPMEQTVMNIDDMNEALTALKNKLEQLKNDR